jgi:hypothetical protein
VCTDGVSLRALQCSDKQQLLSLIVSNGVKERVVYRHRELGRPCRRNLNLHRSGGSGYGTDLIDFYDRLVRNLG